MATYMKFFRLSKEEMTLNFMDKIMIELNRAEEDKSKNESLEKKILESHENQLLQDLYYQQKAIEARIAEEHSELAVYGKNPPMNLYHSYLEKVEKQLPPIRYQIRQLQEKFKISKRLNEAREKVYLASKEIKFIEYFLSTRQDYKEKN